jgi:biopolymer transport protein ExbD/biopolymer transport protein TolR
MAFHLQANRSSDRKSNRKSSMKSEINVTPLVDVVLVLLIIFMVITPLLVRGKAVDLPVAQSSSESKRGGDPVFLSVTADGRLWVDKSEVMLPALSDALVKAMASRPGVAVVLKGDRSMDYKVIRQVLGEVAKANVAGLALATNRLDDKGAR